MFVFSRPLNLQWKMANAPLHGFRRALMAAKSPSTVTPISSATPAIKKPCKNFVFIRKFEISSALAGFLGVPQISQYSAVKKIWEYAKLHNLKNPNNGREIMCDVKLKSIFEGKDKVGFGEIAKLLSYHFVKPTSPSSHPNS